MTTSKTATRPRRLLGEPRFRLLTFLRRSGGTASFLQAQAMFGHKLAGNLSVMSRALEDVGYITITKSFVGRKPRTELTLTPAGDAAIRSHLVTVAELAAMPKKTMEASTA